MKTVLNYLLIAFTILTIVFFVVNVEIVIWNYQKPEGFWGFIWFISSSTTILFAISIFVVALIYFVAFLVKERNLTTIFITFIGGFLITVFIVLNGLSANFLSLLFYHSLSDKYEYINSSERLINKGKFNDAIIKSEKMYLQAIRDTTVISPVWIFQYFIENSDKGRVNAHRNLLFSMCNYAYCLFEGDNDLMKAETLFNNSIEFSKKYFTQNVDYLLFPHYFLIAINFRKGNNEKANYYFLNLNKLLDQHTDEDVDYIIGILAIYSSMADFNGDFENSIALRKQALDIYEKSEKSKEGYSFLSICLPVIKDFLNKNDTISAEIYLSKIEKPAKKYKDDYIYVIYLRVRSQLYSLKNMPTESEECIQEMLEIIEENQGKQSYDYAYALSLLATNSFQNNNYQNAAELFDQSLRIFQKDGVGNLNDYFKLQFNSAIADYYNNETQTSVKKLKQIKSFLISQTNDKFVFLTPEEKESYISQFGKFFKYINAIFTSLNDSSLTIDLYNNALFTKGIALQSNQFIKKQVSTSKNKSLIQDFDTLFSIKDDFQMQTLTGQISDSLYLFKQEEIRNREKQLLSDLSQTPGYKKFSIDEIQWDDIQYFLKKNETAIEIINVPLHLLESSDEMYFALILRPGYLSPKLIPLFKESDVNQLLQVKGKTQEKTNAIYSGKSLEKLYEIIWTPLQNYLSGSKKIYLSVSGLLHQVSITALTIDKDYDVQMLNTTRSITENNQDTINYKNTTCALYGNI